MTKLATDDEILRELREQTKWLRLLGFEALRPVLQQTLTTTKHRAVYEYSDGNRSSRDVAALAGVSQAWVALEWADWIAAGFALSHRRDQAGRNTPRPYHA
jgi:hypothetical protein